MAAHAINTFVHIASGGLALLIGLVPLLSAKGAARHRLWGKAFIAVGVVNLVTAVIGVTFFDVPIPLVVVTLTAGYEFISGRRALAIKHSGPGMADAAMALAALALGAWLLASMDKGTRSWSPMIGYSTLGFAMTIALYDLSRHAWRDLWLARAWKLDHGLKLTGAYFAMMSAGLGNLLRGWQPYSQVGPSVAGLLVAAVLFIRHWRVRSQIAN